MLKIKILIKIILDFFIQFLYSFRKVKKNTILITELNDVHQECLPGYISYFQNLGFNVEVLLTKAGVKQKALCRIKPESIKQYTFYTKYGLKKFLNNKKSLNYEYIFFNSFWVYFSDKLLPCTDFINGVEPVKKFFYQEHIVNKVLPDLVNKNQVFVIADLPYNFLEKKPLPVCPLYFGDIKTHIKNDCITFISVGAIKEKEKKNSDLLEKICEEYHGKYDFKIIICARQSITPEDFSVKYAEHFEVYQNPDYELLYKLVENSDFFLPLLDDKIETHRRYVETGTSGSFQLIYGFEKIPLIGEFFAKPHGLNKKNSLIYEDDNSFLMAVGKACEMAKDEYESYRSSLCELKEKLYANSLEHIKEAMKN